MTQGIYTVLENREIARDVYRMRLAGNTAAITAPGQFVNVRVEGFFLRRPLSVCDWETGEMTLIYKVVGQGTRAMAAWTSGRKADLLAGLGNGFDVRAAGERPLLVGGGAGVPPLYGLARRLRAAGARPVAVLGFRGAQDVFYEDAFSAVCERVHVMTEDGTRGARGRVTDAKAAFAGATYYYACGPQAMLRAVYEAAACAGEMSFEERMGCGFGACMGCTCKTKYGAKRICKDGPVLKSGEVIF